MAVMVDPPQRDSADERSSAQAPTAELRTIADDRPLRSSPTRGAWPRPPRFASEPKLAEPPIPGGHVEALMGRLIRVLSHSRLARPLPAVILSALGLAGVAFVGLCATAPRPSVATPPVLLPLTSVARDLGAPHLPDIRSPT